MRVRTVTCFSKSVALFSAALMPGITTSQISSADGRVRADHSAETFPLTRRSFASVIRRPNANPRVILLQGIQPSRPAISAWPTAAVKDQLAVPLGRASADFDEDSVPDLEVNYVCSCRRLLTLHSGKNHVVQSSRSGEEIPLSPFPPRSFLRGDTPLGR